MIGWCYSFLRKQKPKTFQKWIGSFNKKAWRTNRSMILTTSFRAARSVMESIDKYCGVDWQRGFRGKFIHKISLRARNGRIQRHVECTGFFISLDFIHGSQHLYAIWKENSFAFCILLVPSTYSILFCSLVCCGCWLFILHVLHYINRSFK